MYSGLLDHWPEIVGESYAQNTTPVKVAFPHQPTEPRRKGGTLTIKLPKGLAMEFTYKAETIRQRVNDYFGYDAIAKIVLDTVYILPTKKVDSTPTAEATQQAAAASSDVEDGELRAALEKLGSRILSGKPVKK